MIGAWVEYHQKKGRFKNTTKEERAKELHNVICPRCKYQNKMFFVKRSGKCHLCGTTLDIEYFKKNLIKMIKNKEDV